MQLDTDSVFNFPVTRETLFDSDGTPFLPFWQSIPAPWTEVCLNWLVPSVSFLAANPNKSSMICCQIFRPQADNRTILPVFSAKRLMDPPAVPFTPLHSLAPLFLGTQRCSSWPIFRLSPLVQPCRASVALWPSISTYLSTAPWVNPSMIPSRRTAWCAYATSGIHPA